MSLQLYRLVRNLVQSFFQVLTRSINDQHNLVVILCAQSPQIKTCKYMKANTGIGELERPTYWKLQLAKLDTNTKTVVV